MAQDKSKGRIEDADFGPDSITPGAKRAFFEMGAGKNITINRQSIVVLLLSGALLFSGLANWQYTNLHTVETKYVEVDSAGHLVHANASQDVMVSEQGNLKASNDTKASFASKWVESLFQINPSTIDVMVRRSSDYAVGNAVQQLKQWRNDHNPYFLMKDNQSFSQTYTYISHSFLGENVVYLRFKAVVYGNGAPVTTTWAGTITLVHSSLAHVEDRIEDPAGLFVTDFQINEEVQANGK